MEEEEGHMKLLKASEVARELIRMIDSLSSSPNLDAHAKRAARDLLHGARDLQSSLAVLTRWEVVRPNRFALRESGHYAEVLIKKSRFSQDKFSGSGRASAFRLEQVSEYAEVESRLSAERVEELRRVIADGLSQIAVAGGPKARKVHTTERPSAARKTLDEIITAKFHALRLRKHVGGFKNRDDVIPPIVIMKPLFMTPAKEKIQSENQVSKNSVSSETGKDSARTQSELEQDLMCLLLSSRSFVNVAKELFRIDVLPPVYHKRKVIGDNVMKNPKLYLDCGKELMVRRSRTERGAGTNPVSLRQLAEEISRAMEVLTGYGNADGSEGSEDDMHLRLERDVKCREVMASANWDMGWVNWICSEELNVVVADLEEFFMSWLITDFIQDLL